MSAPLVGEPWAEGTDPPRPRRCRTAVGPRPGPEVRTLRRRIEALASQGRAEELLAALARHHTERGADRCGHLLRRRPCRRRPRRGNCKRPTSPEPASPCPRRRTPGSATPSAQDCSSRRPAPRASSRELKKATAAVRALVGHDARPTIAFDRGGWSPALFTELALAGFDILTYRKGTDGRRAEPLAVFKEHHFTDDGRGTGTGWLADRAVRLSPTSKQATQPPFRPAARSHASTLSPGTRPRSSPPGPTPTRSWSPMTCSAAGGSRTSSATAVPTTASTASTPTPKPTTTSPAWSRTQPNGPRAKGQAGGPDLRRPPRPKPRSSRAHKSEAVNRASLWSAFADARTETTCPSLKPSQSHPRQDPARRGHPEGATRPRTQTHPRRRPPGLRTTPSLPSSASSPPTTREPRTKPARCYERLPSPADLQVIGDELYVRINALSAPRRTRALAVLCQELNATETIYPGTKLTLVYSVKDVR